MKKLFSMLKDNQVGNTLIQIPITLAIIGGISVAGTSLADVLPEARDTRRAADAYQVSQALALYYDDNIQFPVYTGSDAEDSWELLQAKLEPAYIYEFPNDPTDGKSYTYWSDGQMARVFWTSEVTSEVEERRVF